jgi:hypothetical protein
MLLIGIFAFLFLAGISNAIFFDMLIRIEHDRHNLNWEKDGKPIGNFYVPAGGSLFRGSFSRYMLAREWFFRTPVWVNNDAKAQKILLMFRLSGVFLFLWLFSPFLLILFS